MTAARAAEAEVKFAQGAKPGQGRPAAGQEGLPAHRAPARLRAGLRARLPAREPQPLLDRGRQAHGRELAPPQPGRERRAQVRGDARGRDGVHGRGQRRRQPPPPLGRLRGDGRRQARRPEARRRAGAGGAARGAGHAGRGGRPRAGRGERRRRRPHRRARAQADAARRRPRGLRDLAADGGGLLDAAPVPPRGAAAGRHDRQAPAGLHARRRDAGPGARGPLRREEPARDAPAAPRGRRGPRPHGRERHPPALRGDRPAGPAREADRPRGQGRAPRRGAHRGRAARARAGERDDAEQRRLFAPKRREAEEAAARAGRRRRGGRGQASRSPTWTAAWGWARPGSSRAGSATRASRRAASSCATAGAAGHFYGAYAVHGMELYLQGLAADSCFTAAYGGKIVVVPEGADTSLTVVGNTFAYGARAGRAYVAGRGGNRFGICLRKSHEGEGPRVVVEGVEANAFQYMTGGVALVLGSVGFNLGAGLTGGRVYLLDPDGSRLNRAVREDGAARRAGRRRGAAAPARARGRDREPDRRAPAARLRPRALRPRRDRDRPRADRVANVIPRGSDGTGPEGSAVSAPARRTPRDALRARVAGSPTGLGGATQGEGLHRRRRDHAGRRHWRHHGHVPRRRQLLRSPLALEGGVSPALGGPGLRNVS